MELKAFKMYTEKLKIMYFQRMSQWLKIIDKYCCLHWQNKIMFTKIQKAEILIRLLNHLWEYMFL